MTDLAGARDKITRAAGLLVTRFGHEAPVFELLNDALKDLREDPAPRVAKAAPEPEPEPEPEAEPDVEEAGTAEPEEEAPVEAAPEPEPEARPRRRGR